MTGLHTKSPIQAMRKKLIINVAPTGSFTNREQNPRVTDHHLPQVS